MSSEISHRFVIQKILDYWEEFLASEEGQQNLPLKFFYSPFKNSYLYQDFQKVSKKIYTELQPYKEILRELSHLSLYASLVVVTRQENYLNIPYDFLRFNVILGRKKAQELFEWLKTNMQMFQTVEALIGFLNQQLYEGLQSIKWSTSVIFSRTVTTRLATPVFRHDCRAT